MDTKWKKWINTILIAAILVIMTATGIYALMKCNSIASAMGASGENYISLASYDDNTDYKYQIQSDLLMLWAAQEGYGQAPEYGTGMLKENLEKIAKEARMTGTVVIKPYGKKEQKKTSVYGDAKEETQGGEKVHLKITRDPKRELDQQGRFKAWENEEVLEASDFYRFRGDPYIPHPFFRSDFQFIDDVNQWRLESADITLYLTPKAIKIMKNNYEDARQKLAFSLKSFVVIGAIELLGVILLVVLFGLQKKRTRFFVWIDKIWWELIVMGAAGLCFTSMYLFYWIWKFIRDFAQDGTGGTELEIAIMLCSVAAPVIISLFAVCLQTTIWRIKERNLLDSTLCLGYFRKWYRREKERRKLEYEAMSFAQQHAQDRIRQYRLMRIILIVFVFICILAVSAIGVIGPMGFFLGALGIFALWKFNKYSDKYAEEQLDLAKLVEQIERISDGELTAQTDLSKDSVYYKYSRKLTNIGNGMEKALETQMRGERMKIDLITNVSHDLKTPLTSIIGYVDLLSRDSNLSDEAKDYVKILNQKTERLRNIIADLFELAKSTSGDVKVDLEPMDMKKLIEQTLGDMADQIQDSGFEIRFQCGSEHTKFLGDVNRMYRVVQNVIENALKYSLSGTRIYIRITEENSRVKLEVINTASYEMDFTEEEIMERFARAEKSRTSEGNGLGLSIADSFTKNCGGTFEIKINGDQFKVTVQFSQYSE